VRYFQDRIASEANSLCTDVGARRNGDDSWIDRSAPSRRSRISFEPGFGLGLPQCGVLSARGSADFMRKFSIVALDSRSGKSTATREVLSSRVGRDILWLPSSHVGIESGGFNTSGGHAKLAFAQRERSKDMATGIGEALARPDLLRNLVWAELTARL